MTFLRPDIGNVRELESCTHHKSDTVVAGAVTRRKVM